MSTKVDISRLTRKFKDATKLMTEVLNDKSVMGDVVNTVVEDVRYQTRRGLDPDGNKFKPLSEAWVDQRKRVTDSKHAVFSPKRSNLTVTGQLLDALRYKLGRPGEILAYFVGVHSPYSIRRKNNNKTYSSDSISNAQLAEYVQDQGREFIGMRESLIPRIKKILAAAIRRAASFSSKD